MAPLDAGQNVAVIGAPSGIPFKIDSGRTVHSTRPDKLDYFEGTTDTFAGSSGSGVYETETYSLVGILVRGAPAKDSCQMVNVCASPACQSEISYVSTAIEALCASPSMSQTLCPDAGIDGGSEVRDGG